MELGVETRGDITIVNIRGKLAFGDVPQFRNQVADQMGRGKVKFIFNLSGMSFIDSAGLGAFVTLSKRIRERKGDLKIVSPQPQVKAFLEVTGLIKIFRVYETNEGAMESFESEAG
jgi:anti-anti-sigma factor